MRIVPKTEGNILGKVGEAQEAAGVFGLREGFFEWGGCEKQTRGLGGVVAFIK